MNFITVDDLYQKYQSGEEFSLVDVRSPEEYALGHVPSARLLPLDTLINEPNAAIDVLPDMLNLDRLYIICLSDRRSYISAQILTQIGIKNCVYVKGGTQAWKQKGYPLSCSLL